MHCQPTTTISTYKYTHIQTYMHTVICRCVHRKIHKLVYVYKHLDFYVNWCLQVECDSLRRLKIWFFVVLLYIYMSVYTYVCKLPASEPVSSASVIRNAQKSLSAVWIFHTDFHMIQSSHQASKQASSSHMYKHKKAFALIKRWSSVAVERTLWSTYRTLPSLYRIRCETMQCVIERSTTDLFSKNDNK